MSDDLQAQINQLQAQWASCVTSANANTSIAQGWFAGGIDLRINLTELLKLVWHSAKIFRAVHGDAATASELIDIGDDGVEAAVTGLQAFRRSVSPAEYYACVMFASGYVLQCTRAEFGTNLSNFIADATGVLPWYLGLSEKRAEQARKALNESNGAASILRALEKADYAKVTPGAKSADDIVTFNNHYVVWRERLVQEG